MLCADLSRAISQERKKGRLADVRKGWPKDEEAKAAEAELFQRHGTAAPEPPGPRSLKLLCVRELHRQRHPCAVGESDPALIAAKAFG